MKITLRVTRGSQRHQRDCSRDLSRLLLDTAIAEKSGKQMPQMLREDDNVGRRFFYWLHQASLETGESAALVRICVVRRFVRVFVLARSGY